MSVNLHPPKTENASYEFILSGDDSRQMGFEESWKVVIMDEDGAKNGAPFHCSLQGKDASHFTVSMQSKPFLTSLTQNRPYSPSSTIPHFCAIQPSRSSLLSGTYTFELQAVDSGEKVRWVNVPITVKVQTHSQSNTNNKGNNEVSPDKTQSLTFKGLIWMMDIPETHTNFNRRILELSSILTSPTSSLRLEPTSGYLYNLNSQSQALQNFFAVDTQTGIVYLRGNPLTRVYKLGVDIQETSGNQFEGGESPSEASKKYEILLNFEIFSVFDEDGNVKAPWRIAGLRVPGNMARALFYMTDQYRDRIWSLLSEKMERPGMTLKDIAIRSSALTQMDVPAKMERSGRDASDIFILFHTVKPLSAEDVSQWNKDLDHVKKDLESILMRNVTYLHYACQSKCPPLGSPCETQIQAQTTMDGGKAYESFVLGQTAYVVPRFNLVSQCKTNQNVQEKTFPVDTTKKDFPSTRNEATQQKVFLVSSQRDTTWQIEHNLLPIRSLHCLIRWTKNSSGKLLQIETDVEQVQLLLEKGDLAYEIINTALTDTTEQVKRRQGVLSSLMPRVSMEGGGLPSPWMILRVSYRDSVTCANKEWNSDNVKCIEWRILVGSMERSFQSRQMKPIHDRKDMFSGWKIRWGNYFSTKENGNVFEKPLQVEEDSLACVKEVYLNDKEWSHWRGRGLSSQHNGGLVEREDCSIQGCQIDASETVTLPCQVSSLNKETKSEISSNQCPSAIIKCNVPAAHNCLSQSESLSCMSESNGIQLNSANGNVTCQCHTETTTQSLSCQMLPASSITDRSNLFLPKNCPQISQSVGRVSLSSQLNCFVTKEIRRQQLRCLPHNPYPSGFNLNNHESAAMAPSQTFAGLHQHPLFPVPVAILGFLTILIALLLFLKIRQRKIVLRRKRSQRIRNSNLHSPASQDDSPTHLPSPHKLLLSMPSSYSPQGAGIISPANMLPPNPGCHYCEACTYCPPYQASLPNHMQASTLSHSSRSFWDYVSMLEPQPGTNQCTDGSLSPLCQNHTPHIGRIPSNYLQHLQNTTMSSNASGNTAEVASILFNPNSGTPTPMMPHGAATLPVGISSSIPMNIPVQPLEYGLPMTPTDSELMTISRQSTKIPQYWSPCQIERLPVSMNSQSDFSSTCEPHFDHVSLLPNSTVTPCFPRQHKDTNQLLLNECRVNFPSPKDSETWPHNNNTLLY